MFVRKAPVEMILCCPGRGEGGALTRQQCRVVAAVTCLTTLVSYRRTLQPAQCPARQSNTVQCKCKHSAMLDVLLEAISILHPDKK